MPNVHDFDLAKYEIVRKISLSPNDWIVLYSSYPTEEVMHKEILGKEIFRVKDGVAIWQISIPDIPENEVFWRTDNGELALRYDSFNGILLEENELLAHTFQGFEFSVSLATGEASCRKWTKS